jgi:hypothetical protein
MAVATIHDSAPSDVAQQSTSVATLLTVLAAVVALVALAGRLYLSLGSDSGCQMKAS